MDGSNILTFIAGATATFLAKVGHDWFTSAHRRFDVRVQSRVREGEDRSALESPYLVLEIWARKADLTIDKLYLEWNTVEGKKAKPLSDMTITDASAHPQAFRLPYELKADQRIRLAASFPEGLLSSNASRPWTGMWVVAEDESRGICSKSNQFWV